MKLLLICAGGISSSILMRKIEEYAAKFDIDLKIAATGILDYEDISQEYDVVLLSPQVSYKKDEISSNSGKPVVLIEPYDYSIGNTEKIFRDLQKFKNE